MADHYPFTGRADRVAVFGFFERNALGCELQEKYYKWWYDWTKEFVTKDLDLRHAKEVEFDRYPFGLHARANFHLHGYGWATAMIDLGKFIENVIFPRMSEQDLRKLEEAHENMLDALRAKRQSKPRPPAPDVGRYRHV